jgi:membrane protease YdiL (CAAX protease family)
MSGTYDPDSTDLVRIIGRTILAVSALFGLGVLLANLQTGADTVTLDLGPVATAFLFIASGVFAWAVLRAMAQIRDVIIDERIGSEKG